MSNLMNVQISKKGNSSIAIIESDEMLLTNEKSALDLITEVYYEYGCSKIIIKKEAVPEDFFLLRTGLAGEILQKFINYRAKLAIIGEFENYHSKSLHDFIYESNKGNSIFFLPTIEEAIIRLHSYE